MQTIELSKEARAEAMASLRRYFEENMPEPIGELASSLLLNYILEEIGPAIYNRAVEDAQRRMEQRVADLSGELCFAEFQYWPTNDAKHKGKKK